MSVQNALLVISIASAGLVAGLFYGWTASVIPGLRKVEDRTYVSTMQHINREIVNPLFVLPYVLTPLLLGLAAFVQFRNGHDRRAWYLVAAAISYIVGVFGITVGGNIPLNHKLDRFEAVSATTEAISHMRENYETRWNRWHNFRTAASVVSLALAIVATTITQGDASA